MCWEASISNILMGLKNCLGHSCCSSTLLWSFSSVNSSLRALTLACTRTNACMHRIVIWACFRTLCPLTSACSLTNPFKARNARRAYTIQHVLYTISNLPYFKLDTINQKAYTIIKGIILCSTYLNIRFKYIFSLCKLVFFFNFWS